MRRSESLYHLLFLCLLLAAFQHHFPFTSKVQAAKSVGFKISPAEYSSRSTTGHILSPLANEKKTHKAPSGPNPVGNSRPPSRT